MFRRETVIVRRWQFTSWRTSTRRSVFGSWMPSPIETRNEGSVSWFWALRRMFMRGQAPQCCRA